MFILAHMRSKLLSKLVISLAFFGLLSSCAIEQEIYFKEDYSGRYTFRLDYSTMLSLMESDEDQEETQLLDEETTESVFEGLKAIDGVSNMSVSDKDGKMEIAFDFRDLEILNAAMEGADMNMLFSGQDSPPKDDEVARFSVKGKKISYQHPAQDFKAASQEDASLESMNEMINYSFILRFDKEIKKFDNPRAKLDKSGKKLTLSGNLKEITEETLDLDINLKLK